MAEGYNYTVGMYVNGAWQNYIVYVYDEQSSSWKECIPHIYDNGWKECSTT